MLGQWRRLLQEGHKLVYRTCLSTLILPMRDTRICQVGWSKRNLTQTRASAVRLRLLIQMHAAAIWACTEVLRLLRLLIHMARAAGPLSNSSIKSRVREVGRRKGCEWRWKNTLFLRLMQARKVGGCRCPSKAIPSKLRPMARVYLCHLHRFPICPRMSLEIWDMECTGWCRRQVQAALHKAPATSIHQSPRMARQCRQV